MVHTGCVPMVWSQYIMYPLPMTFVDFSASEEISIIIDYSSRWNGVWLAFNYLFNYKPPKKRQFVVKFPTFSAAIETHNTFYIF